MCKRTTTKVVAKNESNSRQMECIAFIAICKLGTKVYSYVKPIACLSKSVYNVFVDCSNKLTQKFYYSLEKSQLTLIPSVGSFP